MTPEELKRFGEWKRLCRRQDIANCAIAPNMQPVSAITPEERKREMAERMVEITRIIEEHEKRRQEDDIPRKTDTTHGAGVLRGWSDPRRRRTK